MKGSIHSAHLVLPRVAFCASYSYRISP